MKNKIINKMSLSFFKHYKMILMIKKIFFMIFIAFIHEVDFVVKFVSFFKRITVNKIFQLFL